MVPSGGSIQPHVQPPTSSHVSSKPSSGRGCSDVTKRSLNTSAVFRWKTRGMEAQPETSETQMPTWYGSLACDRRRARGEHEWESKGALRERARHESRHKHKTYHEEALVIGGVDLAQDAGGLMVRDVVNHHHLAPKHLAHRAEVPRVGQEVERLVA